MFDQAPSTTGTRAVAATNADAINTRERRTLLYIEDCYDPDKHDPAEANTKYIVPLENEIAIDVLGQQFLRAAYVDYQGGTLKTTWTFWSALNPNDGSTAEQDWIYGLRGGPMMGEALLSIDYSQRPNVARVDSTIMRPAASYAKVFLGNDYSGTSGKVISAQYDGGGIMINNMVPVRLAEIVDRTNQEIMTTGPFSVTENAEALPDGKRCFLVFYDEGGNFIPPAQPLMVQHCAYMRDHQIGTKYVTDIELLTPWFTNTMSPDQINIPVNVLVTAIEWRAVVHYSDGSVSESMPVNGDRFNLYGLTEYRPTWPAQEGELQLVYKFAPNEQRYIAKPGAPDHESKTYKVMSTAVKGAYSPKIYTFPQWDPSIAGYRLQHWLLDLDRKTCIDVTAKVKFNDKSEPWRPTAYGITQTLIFNLNLRDVSTLYESVIFRQFTSITLWKDVNGPGKRFDVLFSANKPVYQAKNVAVRNNGLSTTFNVTNGYATQAAWLDGLYRGVEPSFSSFDEEKAPDPTHFYLVHEDGRSWSYPLAAWNLDNGINIELQKGKTWYLRWVQRLSSGQELQLAITGVTVELVG